MPFAFEKTPIEGMMMVRAKSFGDDRGFFAETYKASEFIDAGIIEPFVQDNHSFSSGGVLRGLHYQLGPMAQGKLVRAIAGTVWDVGVDLRRSSASFGEWFGIELSGENHTMLYVPPGFGHGFLVLSDTAHVVYKCTAEYSKQHERSVRYDDPELAIDWPAVPAESAISLSDKDAHAPLLGDAEVFA